MGDIKQTNMSHRSLSEIRESVQQQMDRLRAASQPLPDEFQLLFQDLTEYNEVLEKREKAMQGALVNLVDDMSQTSQTLTETGTRLDAILEAARDVAFIIAEEGSGKIIEFSSGAETIFGYSRDEILGNTTNKLCPQNEDGGCPLREQSRIRHIMQRKSGESFPAVYSAYPLKDNNDQPVATLIIALDVSKQEMAEKFLKESQERYRALVEISPISIMAFDQEGIVTFVNDWHMNAFDMGRMQPEYYLGRKIYEVQGIVRAGIDNKIRSVLDGNTVALEDVYVPPFGERGESWQNIRTAPLMQDGEFKGGILIREDVTRRKQTENELKMLIDSSPIPLLKVELTEGGGIIRELNPEAEAMLGDSVRNKPVDDFIKLIPEEDTNLEAMNGERCEVTTPDGVRQAIRTAHQPSDKFEIQAVMDVGVLLEAKEAAEDASRAKSDFLANISHEIRTPLNVLLGMLQLFQELDLGEEANEMADHATGAAKSLLALLNDILDFSVVEARALALDENIFDLKEIIDLVAMPYKVEAANKGVQLDYTIAPDIPERMMGDGRRLRQIFFHVTGNAVKFTDTGSIDIRVSMPQETIRDDRGMITITVTDTGIGMTDKQMDHIFEPFRQADGSRRRRHGGTGIGLALVNEFVAAMGGEITIDSTPDQGTTLTFTVEAGIVTIPDLDM